MGWKMIQMVLYNGCILMEIDYTTLFLKKKINFLFLNMILKQIRHYY